MEVTEINRVEDLDRLRDAWRQLLRETPNASFFQSLEWLEAVYRHSPYIQKLRTLVVGSPTAPVGIVPLVVRKEARKIGASRTLCFPLEDWGSYYGPIGPRPAEALLPAINHVLATKRDWDLFDFRWTPPEELDDAGTLTLLTASDLAVQTRIRHQTSIIDLTGTWEEYVASRSKSWRSHFRRQRKKLTAAGEVRFERYRPRGEAHGECDPRWDLYDACTDLAELSWQGSSTTGNTLCHPEVRDFLRSVHEAGSKLGCVEINLLYLDDRPLSFAYNYCFDGRVFGLRLGYDPEMRKLAPGNMIETMAIEDSFRRGDSIYELGPDALESKRQLRTRLQPVWQHTHYSSRSVFSQLLRAKSATQSWLNPLAPEAPSSK